MRYHYAYGVFQKVVIKILRYFGLFIAAALMVFLTTKGDYHFHTSDVEQIDSDMLRSATHYSYYQYYEVHTPLQFRLDIESDKLSKRATLLWPKEPYTKILILSGRTDDGVNNETVFRGRLVNCLYKCIPSGMPIIMDDFEDLIKEAMPQYRDKEETRKLPMLIFDSIDVPMGFNHYLGMKQYHFIALGVAFLFGIGVWIWDTFKKSRD